jgi:hypothetical protein
MRKLPWLVLAVVWGVMATDGGIAALPDDVSVGPSFPSDAWTGVTPPPSEVMSGDDDHYQCRHPSRPISCAGYCGSRRGCYQCCNRGDDWSDDQIKKCQDACSKIPWDVQPV